MITPQQVIAVHISYESRAAERGRRPDAPSYFLKPASSVVASGGTVARPAGTELLAFEGEIALIIGATANRVPLERAWDCVASVTAANDWGLYDLRSADKGSNLRNKGRDGYTPLGPEVIDASACDPRGLRVRTWKNGFLVQEDTSAGLIFSFAQLIADLSQHLTLHPGDVILTGTPAGATVAEPGDVVEVEVDVPATGVSTGRLISTVVEGEHGFDPALGTLPSVDDLQREEAWGSRRAAGLPERAEDIPVPSPLTPELLDKLRRAPVASLSQQMRKEGLNNVSIDGVRTTSAGTKMVGLAKTLRFVPNREDLFTTYGGAGNAQRRAFDTVAEGEVIVIEARGETGSGTMGDVLALRASVRGAAGVVTDGGVRDYATVAAMDLPVFTAGPHAAVLGRKHVPWDTDVTIACGGATVQPGDIIVGDDDGVVVIPPGIAEKIADGALAKEAEDEWVAEKINNGEALDGLFPMNKQWRARYEAEQSEA